MAACNRLQTTQMRCLTQGRGFFLSHGTEVPGRAEQGWLGSSTVTRDSGSFLPGSSVGPGWLLELLPSHLQLSQPLKDLSWKPHPEQSLLTSRWPLQAAKEAEKFSVLA